MKKNPFLIAVLSLIGMHNVFSQDLHIGIRGSIVLSNAKIDYTDANNKNSFGSKLTPNLGIFIDLPIDKKFSFRPEISWIQKGVKETVRDQNGINIYTFAQRMPYVDLALNFVSHLKAGKAMLVPGISPIFGIALKNYTIPVKSVDFGAGINLGYETRGGFFASINFAQGFTNVSANKEYINSIKHKYFLFGIGYIF